MTRSLATALPKGFNPRPLLFTAVAVLLLGWPVYTFLSEYLSGGIHDRGAFKDVNLKALGYFDMNEADATLKDVPPLYRALDGKRVALVGQIWAGREVNDVTEFELVYSVNECCFNGPPKVQERVYTSVAKGKPFRYIGRGDHEVLGTLHVTMKKDPGTGRVTEVYHLDADSVAPKN